MKNQILVLGIVAALMMIKVSNVNAQWSLTGNSDVTSQNFLGTTSSSVFKDLVIKTNGSERLRITSSGKVGIGTTSPSSKLQVKSDVNTNPFQVSVSGVTKLMVKTNGGTMIGFGPGETPPTDGLMVYGSVGVGTSTPSYKFHVLNTGYTRSAYFYNNYDAGTATNYGIYNEVSDLSTGDKFGIYSKATSGAASGAKVFGVAGNAFSSSGISTQYGVYGYASGAGAGNSNYGVFGEASGEDAWAGYFSGSKTFAEELRVGGETGKTGYKLSVTGKIACEEIMVENASNWPDYVFQNNYKLLPLREVEIQIQNTGHLPDMPSAKDIEANGLALGDMSKRMMEKIEELTLYVIEQDKKIELLEAQLKSLQINSK